MKFKNPCKRCIVQAACSQLCEAKDEYGSILAFLESTCDLLLIFGIAIPSAIMLANLQTYIPEIKEVNQILQGLIHFIGVIIICGIICLSLYLVNLYFRKEISTYRKQRAQYNMRSMGLGRPNFPRGRRIP